MLIWKAIGQNLTKICLKISTNTKWIRIQCMFDDKEFNN